MNLESNVIQDGSPDYPKSLARVIHGKTLYALGNLALLSTPAIGICGSRAASPEAQGYALEFGKQAAARGFTVVSGYARGVDRQAHRGAMEAGGNTLAMLAEGINFFKPVLELRSLIDMKHNFLAVSMFEPGTTWAAWRAMERNKLIVGASIGLFVVEARAIGGTINSAIECARQDKPLWAIAYSTEKPGREGNRELLQHHNAIPLKRLADVQTALDHAMTKTSTDIRQLALNLVGV